LAVIRKVQTFFFENASRIKLIDEQHEEAVKELIARDPVKYHKRLFRAFLGLGRKEVEDMSFDEYNDNVIMLRETLKLLHAPYLTHNE